MGRLPVISTIQVAFRATSRHMRPLAASAVVPLILYMLISVSFFRELYIGLSTYLNHLSTDSFPMFMTFGEFIIWVADAGQAVELIVLRIVLLPVIASCYLRFLQASGDGRGHHGGRMLDVSRRLFLPELLCTLLVYIPAIPVFSEIPGLRFYFWKSAHLFVLYFPVSMIVALRLSLALPDIALGRRWAMSEQWRQTRGNVWRLVAIAALLILMFLTSCLVFNLLAHSLEWRVFTFRAPSPLDSLALFLLVAIFEVVKVAAICFAYTTLTGRPAFGLPGAERSQEELTEVFD